MPVLLACYELGHQPLSLAWPKAILSSVGIEAHVVDLHVEEFPNQAISNANFVGIAAPMHTALRLGIQAAKKAREINPQIHICFYGLYAWLNREFLLDEIADSIIGGEYDQSLTELIQDVLMGSDGENVSGIVTKKKSGDPVLSRLQFPVPDRQSLPSLKKYAHYTEDGLRFKSGYVESTRGCLHTCKHCPVVPVYEGRFFVVPIETVLADIRQQVDAGAKHITFGDPDFLNGPNHALEITRKLHAEFPNVTFDFTAKVEHIIKNKALMKEFKEMGCSMIISAFEATNDKVLDKLDKGHTVEQMTQVLEILRKAGISPQPTWMPFTPWTSLQDYIDLLKWIRNHNLIQQVPVVQLGVRMLLPPESKLIEQEQGSEWLGELDSENLSYRWTHPDPRMDKLYQEVIGIAESSADLDSFDSFKKVEEAAFNILGEMAPFWAAPIPTPPEPPKLTEHWFC